MDWIYFFARHAPFWGIPALIISAEFGYLYWLKKRKKSSAFFVMIASISFVFLSFYYWTGGPEGVTNTINSALR